MPMHVVPFVTDIFSVFILLSFRDATIRVICKMFSFIPAELYMDNGQLSEAKDALDEAARITNLDVETLFLVSTVDNR